MTGASYSFSTSITSCQSPDVTALLRVSAELLAATDLDSVIGAARTLLGDLVPGTQVQRFTRGVGTQVCAGAFGRQIQISLSKREILLVTAPENENGLAWLNAAAGLIERRVESLGRQNALADSVEHLGRSERLQRALFAIADQASSAGDDLTAMYQALHGIISSLMYAENFYIALYDAAHDTVRFAYYADVADPNIPDRHEDIPMTEILHGPTWYMLRDGKPLMGSPELMGRAVERPFHIVGAVCKDWLGVPLLHGPDVVGGVVVQSYDDAHHYTEKDKTLLIYVAQHIQTALERRLAHVDLERRVNERTAELQQQVLERQRGERLQAALFRIAEMASTTDSIENFYASVHRVVADLLYARNFYIALLSEDGSQLTFPYLVDERDEQHQPRRLANGLTEYVMRSGKALLADSAEVARLRALGEVAQHGPRSDYWLGVPLVCSERTVGVLVVQSYSPEKQYSLRDQELLTFVSYHIANALERIRAAESLRCAYADLGRRVEERTGALALANRDLHAQIAERERVEERLKYETLHDPLTGLPNRTQLTECLTQALASEQGQGKGFAVLFMDLDRFKVINDSVGHLVGDALLSEVGKRISACLKPRDMVARLGGDEFSVLLMDIVDADMAGRVADRIINSLNAPFVISSKELFTSASIGIVLSAAHYQSPEELLRDADAAMYRAKAEGRHRCVVFDENLRKEAVSLLEVENDLRRGLTRSELVPYYQPIVNLEKGTVIGYEALMRWRHPRRGIVLPGEFLSVAEESAMSEAMDWQIFTHACRDANALAGDNGCFISINLSARHFRNPRLDQQLLGLLAEYGVPASRFRVEVTERALLENTPTVKRVLQTLRRADIGISLDDFGTGYSSLSYLHQYPLQILKIDRSFVADLTGNAGGGSAAVVRAILALAKSLSLQVVAEGVETVKQRDILRRLGCDHVQGFLYSKAQPVDTWIGGVAPVFPV